MAQGLPQGFVRLFDENGNFVGLAIKPDGTYALSVSDDRARLSLEHLLEEILEQQKLIVFHLSSITDNNLE